MATLFDMRASLRDKVGNPSVADKADALLTEHINSAYSDITDRYPFSIMRGRVRFNTAQGTGLYNLGAGYTVVLKAYNRTRATRLRKIGDREAGEVDLLSVPGATTQGCPVAYARWGDGVQLYPQPDGIYEIECYLKKSVTPLSADGDTPVIPASWHQGIVLLARWYYYDAIGDVPKSEHSYNTFKLWLADKPSEFEDEKQDIDSGVVIPTLSPSRPRLDFDHDE